MTILPRGAGEKSTSGYDGPRKDFAGAGLDRLHGGEVFMGEIQEIAGVRVGDFRNLFPMLPDNLPTPPFVRDSCGRAEIRAQDLVLD